jgi:hypothetical protein
MNVELAKRNEGKSVSIPYALFLGFVYACTTSFLALNIAAGGDGWNAVIISWCGLLLIPLASSTWMVGAHPARRAVAFGVLVLMMLADILLVNMRQPIAGEGPARRGKQTLERAS